MINKVSLILLSAILSCNVIAAEFKGRIQTIATGPNLGNVILVKVENHSSSAVWSTSCSTDQFWSFKFDPSVPGGMESYSLLLAAYAAEKKVVINGTGTCTSGEFDDVQDLHYTRFDY